VTAPAVVHRPPPLAARLLVREPVDGTGARSLVA
jgi:hypothetical protein